MLMLHCAHRIQLVAVRATFDKLDLNGNGLLSRDEIQQASQDLNRALHSDDALDAAMAAMDTDGDGEVNYEEFCEWWEAGGKLSPLEALDLKWSMFGKAFDDMAHGLLKGAVAQGGVQIFDAAAAASRAETEDRESGGEAAADS